MERSEAKAKFPEEVAGLCTANLFEHGLDQLAQNPDLDPYNLLFQQARSIRFHR